MVTLHLTLLMDPPAFPSGKSSGKTSKRCRLPLPLDARSVYTLSESAIYLNVIVNVNTSPALKHIFSKSLNQMNESLHYDVLKIMSKLLTYFNSVLAKQNLCNGLFILPDTETDTDTNDMCPKPTGSLHRILSLSLYKPFFKIGLRLYPSLCLAV